MKAWSTKQLGSFLTVIQLKTKETGIQSHILSSRTHGLNRILHSFPDMENTTGRNDTWLL